MSGEVGFDEAVFVDERGAKKVLNRDRFLSLPLGDRIKLILEKKVEFRLNGQVVPTKVAMGR